MVALRAPAVVTVAGAIYRFGDFCYCDTGMLLQF